MLAPQADTRKPKTTEEGRLCIHETEHTLCNYPGSPWGHLGLYAPTINPKLSVS